MKRVAAPAKPTKKVAIPVIVRHTRQKQALRNAFLSADRPLSPEEALTLAKRDVPLLSLATVYRNIGTLVEEGWLTTVELPGSSSRYEVSGKQHHHHFQCRTCERVYELAGCGIPTRPSVPKGFLLSGHEFFLYGTCASCR